jgi:hypothetical protein
MHQVVSLAKSMGFTYRFCEVAMSSQCPIFGVTEINVRIAKSTIVILLRFFRPVRAVTVFTPLACLL